MIRDYCCENLRDLKNADYIDGERVYLQRFDINTNLPLRLRQYQYCVTCGEANYVHPVDNVPDCLTLRNGINLNQFRRERNGFTFNLNTRNEYAQFIQGDRNFPAPAALIFCPYCGIKIRRK